MSGSENNQNQGGDTNQASDQKVEQRDQAVNQMQSADNSTQAGTTEGNSAPESQTTSAMENNTSSQPEDGNTSGDVTFTVTGTAFKGKKEITAKEGQTINAALKDAGLSNPTNYTFRDEKGAELKPTSKVRPGITISSVDKTEGG